MKLDNPFKILIRIIIGLAFFRLLWLLGDSNKPEYECWVRYNDGIMIPCAVKVQEAEVITFDGEYGLPDDCRISGSDMCWELLPTNP